jgi:hypothetical protein
MRKQPIDALFPRTRSAILRATVLEQDRWWYLSDLAKHLGVRPSSLQRELESLVAVSILRKKREGRQVFFQPDPACPFLPELRRLLAKIGRE